MKRLYLLASGLAAGVLVAFAPATSQAGLIGSTHDFSPGGGAGALSTNGYATFKWGGETNTYSNPCQICHVPHKAAPYSLSHAPLWNHALSANSYVTYDQAGSVTFNALNLSVALGSSIACLSCHDGSVAINQSYSQGGTTNYNQNGNLNGNGTAAYVPSFAVETVNSSLVAASGTAPWVGYNNLTRMHPIGVNYVDAASKDPELKPISGILDTAMLKGKGATRTVECASCHDIHRTQGASATISHDLIVDLNGGQLCLTCHNK
jgi:hypothetical protein